MLHYSQVFDYERVAFMNHGHPTTIRSCSKGKTGFWGLETSPGMRLLDHRYSSTDADGSRRSGRSHPRGRGSTSFRIRRLAGSVAISLLRRKRIASHRHGNCRSRYPCGSFGVDPACHT